MKTSILILITCSTSILYSQTKFSDFKQSRELNAKSIEILDDIDNTEIDISENNFGVGIGFGPSWNLGKTYSYYVSPYDTTLRRNEINTPVFVGSLLFTWNPMVTYKRYQPNDTDKATGESFNATSRRICHLFPHGEYARF